ncbi:MAG: hypothetical protein CL402_06710 [Acidiferrobacteraceae bacterium]|nr:hypothetical protein [Acidiferrobacteraceae bacterium]
MAIKSYPLDLFFFGGGSDCSDMLPICGHDGLILHSTAVQCEFPRKKTAIQVRMAKKTKYRQLR